MSPDPRLRIVGFQWSPSTREIKDFLARNRVAYEWLDIETHPAARAGAGPELRGGGGGGSPGLRPPRQDPFRVVRLDDDTELFCHAVLLALGISWRTLEAPGCRNLVGRGIYYGAAAAEATSCREQDVFLLGGGNSAGQAAMLLSRFARSVTLVAPEVDFAERMSEYLLDRLEGTDKRIGAAVGEGAMAIQHIHEYLREH
jgi:hypothetical protein